MTRLPGHSEAHILRSLVAESLEVYAAVFALLTSDEPDVALAANEVQQAHARVTKAMEER